MLETFEDNKSPGEDEFTAEFYKHFFDLVGTDLINSLNQAFEVGELSISQQRGVITLIPKDSDLLNLQNWRPITLFNIDYKIASKTLAKRIENVLPKLVHSDHWIYERSLFWRKYTIDIRSNGAHHGVEKSF